MSVDGQDGERITKMNNEITARDTAIAALPAGDRARLDMARQQIDASREIKRLSGPTTFWQG
jgi:hypothetical protein